MRDICIFNESALNVLPVFVTFHFVYVLVICHLYSKTQIQQKNKILNIGNPIYSFKWSCIIIHKVFSEG